MTHTLPPVSNEMPRENWRVRFSSIISVIDRVRYILSSALRVMAIFMVWVILMVFLVRLVDILAFWAILKRALHIPS